MKEMTLDRMETKNGGSFKSMCFWLPTKIILNDMGNYTLNIGNYALAAACEKL